MYKPTPRRNRKIHKRPRCAATGLVRLRDKKDANLELRAAYMMRATAAANGRDCAWTVVRSFSCSSCGGHHLTSRASTVQAVVA